MPVIDNLDRVHASLKKHLYPIVGPEVAMLPVFVNRDNSGPIAHTTNEGIWLRQNVVDNDPDNAHVYVMHEIMHHVVGNHEHTYKFLHVFINIAEDYWINYTQNILWGFDIRKVMYQGIYSTRLGKLLPHIACEEITKKHANGIKGGVLGCGCSGIAHPAIVAAALKLRKRFNIGVESRQGKLVQCDPLDLEVYEKSFSKIRGIVKLTTIPVDLQNLAEGVWMAAYKDTVVPAKVNRILTVQEMITYCWNNSEVRQHTVNNADRASLAALHYIKVLDYFDHMIHDWISRAHQRIKKYQDKINAELNQKRPKKRLVKKYEKRITQANTRIERLQLFKPIKTYFYDHPIERSIRTSVSVNAMKFVPKKPPPTSIIPVKYNITLRMIRLISNIATKRFLKSKDFHEELEDAFGAIVNAEAEEVEDNSTPRPSTPFPSFPNQEDDENEEHERGPEDYDEEDDEDEDEEESLENEEEKDDEEPIPLPPGGSSGGGRSRTPTKKKNPPATMLQLLAELDDKQLQKIHNILFHMQEFETLLKNSSARNMSEDDVNATMFHYSNDLSRIEASEYAMLGHDATKMLFYSKLADGALLSRQPQEAKRQPLAISIDSSGSMQGAPYETACGFGLAMMKRIASDNRGGMLNIFSEDIAFSIVMRKGKPFRLNEVLFALLHPQFGGTNFDQALGEVYLRKEEEKWKNVTTMLVTDGGDCLSSEMTAILKQKKTRYDRIIAALVKGSDSGLNGLNDEAYRVSRNGMTNDLAKIGNNLL